MLHNLRAAVMLLIVKGCVGMAKVIKAKSVSYGLVELVDNQSGWGQRYSIHVDGKVKEQSNDLTFMIGVFDRKYH